MIKLPISAIIVGYNEASLLPECLSSLWFCNEILYADLNSTDSSINIALEYTDKIFNRSLAPSGEYIQSEIVHLTKNPWVIFIDPDEKIDESLAYQIVEQFKIWVNSETVGAILVPWQFYFKKYKLKGTVWGAFNKKILLVNKHRFVFKPITHYGRHILPNFETEEIVFNGNSNVLHHYWMYSWTTFFRKHFRYLKREGIDQYNQGRRFKGYLHLIKAPFHHFKSCFLINNGYRDGAIGLFLSLFWTFYQTYIEFNIYLLSKKLISRPFNEH